MNLLWHVVWKEWLGLRWKFAALSAILLGFQLSLVIYDRTLLGASFFISLVAYNAIAPIFLAMHVAASERSEGTLEFVRGLPISLAQLGLVRVLTTLILLVVPIAAIGILAQCLPDSYFQPASSDAARLIWMSVITGTSVAVSLYLWTTALGMNQPTELRVGMIGLALVAVWGAWTTFSVAGGAMLNSGNGPGDWTWLTFITALGPFAVPSLFERYFSLGRVVAVGLLQMVSCTLLVFSAVRRYGILESHRPGRAIQFSSAKQALWWLQWRQGRPLVVVGLMLVALSFSRPPADFSIGLGCLWGIIVSATLFSAELEPKLLAFWRSRPIDPGDWFWIKYLAGAVTLLVFIDLPAACLDRFPTATISQEGGALAYVACVPALHLAVYSLAVLIVCVVRNVIYSGILSMGTMLFLVLAPLVVAERGFLNSINIALVLSKVSESFTSGPWTTGAQALLVYLAFTLSLAVAATTGARLAIQNDYAVRA